MVLKGSREVRFLSVVPLLCAAWLTRPPPALQRVLRAVRPPEARQGLDQERLVPPHARDARVVCLQGLHLAQGVRARRIAHPLGLGEPFSCLLPHPTLAHHTFLCLQRTVHYGTPTVSDSPRVATCAFRLPHLQFFARDQRLTAAADPSSDVCYKPANLITPEQREVKISAFEQLRNTVRP